MIRRPEDLISLKEAAAIVGRSVSTLRGWIRTGELQGYRELGEDPNSRLLVSRQELLALAARSKPVHPGGSRSEEDRSDSPDVSFPGGEKKAARPAEERWMLATLTAEREGLRAVVEAQKLTIAALEARCRDLEAHMHSERLRAGEHQDRLVAAEAELQALRGWQRLPWYRRLLGAPASLPPSDDNA